MSDLFDYQPTGRQLADEGMTAAVEHADAVEPSWSDDALKAIWRYALTNAVFAIEDVKEHAYANGLPEPPAGGSWGAPTKKAAKQGYIRRDGYRVSTNPSRHAQDVKLWRSQIYGA